MPIGTSDGEHFKDEFEQVAQNIPSESSSPFTPVEPDELKSLLWDTPIFSSKDPYLTPKTIDELVRITPEDRKLEMDEWNSFAKRRNEEVGRESIGPQKEPLPAGRIRGRKIPAVDDYLKSLPEDVEAIDPGDGTVIFRLKAKDKPPLTSRNEEEDKGIDLSKVLEGAALSTMFLVPAKSELWNDNNRNFERRQIRYGENGRYHIIHAESGKHAGYVDVTYRPGTKTVYIDYITHNLAPGQQPGRRADVYTNPAHENISARAAQSNYNNQTLGARQVIELAREAKRIFPEAERVLGDRVSGARWMASSEGRRAQGGTRQAVMLPKEKPMPEGRILSEAEWRNRQNPRITEIGREQYRAAISGAVTPRAGRILGAGASRPTRPSDVGFPLE
jgi:hypothetical protein